MDDQRLGPPTPRSERPYAARDAAFTAWARQGLCIANAAELVLCRAIFNAGWEARKRVQYAPAEKD